MRIEAAIFEHCITLHPHDWRGHPHELALRDQRGGQLPFKIITAAARPKV